MQGIYRNCVRLLSLVLAFSIFLSSGPVPLPKAIAQAESQAERQAEVDQDRLDKLEELRLSILDPAKNQSELDPFQILRQRTFDDRPDKLEALQQQMKFEDFEERKAHFESQIQSLKELENKVQQKLMGPQLSADQVSELNLVLSDIQSRQQLTALELEDLKQFDPKNGKALPVDFMIDKAIKTTHYWGNNLVLRFESAGAPVFEIQQKEFTNSLSPRFSKGNPLAGFSSAHDVTFSLTSPKGHVLNQFLVPVDGALFFGQYLVYLEKSALTEMNGQLQVRFIDLNYFKANLGNAPLPVYTMPLKVTEAARDLKIENGFLKIGAQALSYQQFAMLSQVQQLVFNVNVALADPKTYENVQPLIDEIAEFMKKSMAHQDEVFKEGFDKAIGASDFLSKISTELKSRPEIKADDVRKLIETSLKDGQLSQQEFDKMKVYLDSQEGLKSANGALADGKKLTTRIELLMHYLIQPRPQGSPKLLESLMMIAFGSKDERSRILDWRQGSILTKLLKYGSGTAGLLVAGTFLPEPYTINMYNTMDLISAVHQHFQGYLSHIEYGKSYAVLAKDAFITSTTGWTYFFQSYFADGVWAKFLYGLGSVLLVPLKVFGSIHLTVNSYKMLTESIRIRNLSGQELSFIQAFKQAAQKDQKAYWDSLAEAERKVSGSDAQSLTETELKLLNDHIERLRSGRESLDVLEKEVAAGKLKTQKGLGQLLTSLGGALKLNRFAKKTEAKLEKTSQEMGLKSVETLRSAIASTYLSYSALRSTFKANAIIWNYLFITRSYVFSPAKWFMYLIYPNYFNATVTTREGQQHFPSRFNSGLELWPQKLQKTISKIVHKTPLRESSFAEKYLLSEETLKTIAVFENYVAPMEAVAIEVAKKKAQKALIETIQDPKRIMVLFDSSQGGKEASTGIRHLHDPKFEQLTDAEKTFYRAYFTRSFDLIMQGFVAQTQNIDSGMQMDPVSFAKKVVSDLKSGKLEPVPVSEEKLNQVESDLEKIINFSDVKIWALQVGQGLGNFVTKVDIQFRHKLLQSIHPNNPQIKRFLTSKAKVNEPRAMERAMRMEVSSMLTSIPMGIISTLALYAGVSSGILMPFNPEGMNTETHLNYMSRYLFYSGFIPGLIIGLMANTWMKVQEDARIDAIGGFDKAVKFTDAKKGFWRYYMKNFLKNPDNKWADNHMYMLKLITANIPAAAVTIIVSNLYGLGRIDVGSFVAGYLLIYTMFLTGLGVKMGQAFELASAWVYDKVPRKLRASPEAQKYISSQLQRKKNAFSIYENVYRIGIEDAIVGTMFMLKDNIQYGTRAFERLVFGGETSTGIVVNFVEKIARAFQSIPGVSSVADMIQVLFSNNYEAFERYPDQLGTPDAVKTAMENTGLPKHSMGEFLGKAGGMISTFGFFTAIPYIVAEMQQRKRSGELQKAGEQAQLKITANAAAPVALPAQSALKLRCEAVFN